jgi:hypothetical protein
VKRFLALLIVMALAALPVIPMPRTYCYRMPAATTVHPCCPVTSVRIPAARATIRRAAAVSENVPRTSYVLRATIERAVFAPAELGHYREILSTIQLRI